MKLSKTKKIFLLGTTLAILTISIAVPIVLLNKDEKNQENDVEKIFKILKAKTVKEKTIELSSNTSGKIIADNQAKIIEKIKTLIGKANLKEVKIEVLMKNDTNISTTPQKIIIKLTKNEVSKEIEDFLIKKKNVIDEDIAAIKKILESKTGNDLIITLPSSSTGDINDSNNRNEILKKLRILIDSSNTSGNSNHPSLRGTFLTFYGLSLKNLISTTPQYIDLKISKTIGESFEIRRTFQVKRNFTADEDIAAIKKILESKTGNDLIITLPSSSTGDINDTNNRNEILKKLRILIDSSNTSGNSNHPSLRGTFLTFYGLRLKNLISTTPQYIDVKISKNFGKTLSINQTFQVKKF